jgi:hypothetical protein
MPSTPSNHPRVDPGSLVICGRSIGVHPPDGFAVLVLDITSRREVAS